MIISILNDNKKSIVTPAFTALGIWAIALLELPSSANYYAPFVSELIVLLIIYCIAIKIERDAKNKLDQSDKETLELYDSEVEKRQKLMNGVNPLCEKAREESEALYSKAVKERDAFFSTIADRKKRERGELEKNIMKHRGILKKLVMP
ncbi:hypothetical protein ACED16_18615 [Enterobacter hormaechei]